jgi:hypothetical protein
VIYLISLLQVFFKVRRGYAANGYVAIDDVVFFSNDQCETQPAWAQPGYTTTEPSTVTTQVPPSKNISFFQI